MHMKVVECPLIDNKECDHTDSYLKQLSINLNIAIDFSIQNNKLIDCNNALHNIHDDEKNEYI